MLGCKPSETPIDPNHKLSANTSSEVGQYQRLVEKLIYLSYTRSDIAFVVSVVSQFMQSSNEEHMRAVIRILQYLK